MFGPKRAEEVTIVEEEPKSVSANRALWRLCKDLNPEEISILISKRREDLKYETNSRIIKKLKADILLLTNAYNIIKKRNKGEKE